MQKKDTEKYDFSYRICRPRSLPAGIKKTYNSFTVVRLQVDALSATVCYDMLGCIFQQSMSGMMGAYRCILTKKDMIVLLSEANQTLMLMTIYKLLVSAEASVLFNLYYSIYFI